MISRKTTLRATLVRPTAHKEEKLRDLLDTYSEALHAAFDAGCSTMSETNGVVTPFELPYQAKDALKRYVPQLRSKYGARKVNRDQPIRFVNRAAVFDHDPERTHEFTWQVPQAGRGTNFWVPLGINPDQSREWRAIVDGRGSPGELRLLSVGSTWELHVSVELPVDTPDSDHETVIGLDVGESTLVTGCLLERGYPMAPVLIDGGRARRLRKECHTLLKRLQQRGAEEARFNDRLTYYQNAITDIIERASREVVDYAEHHEGPVLAMENLSGIRDNVDYGTFMNRRLHSWAFSRIQGRIGDKALKAGIPVVFVDPRYTSRTCHACGHAGSRPEQARFRCLNDHCHITDFHADINAAANIAKRIDPWGESVPWKPERHDSPRDGSPRDRASGPGCRA